MESLKPRDVLSKEDYERLRPETRRRIMVQKDRRRIAVGDHCTLHFECRDTMLYQVHEMLRAENSWHRPGALQDEIEAYSPIVPAEGELSATLMFEYETPEERATMLPALVGIDRHVFLEIGTAAPLLARFDRGQIDEDKVSSVQYVKWVLDDTRRRLLKEDGVVVRIRIDHSLYAAQAVLSEESRRAIASDPD
ncbi:MAG: DUF3501 family protein [Acidobacteriia bacterium]|nr:DUF3501 family protein [Terriglobia bacterium]